MTSEPFKAAAVAMHCVHDRQANLGKIRDFIRRAAAEGARLIVFPEAALQGFLFNLDGSLNPDERAYIAETAEPIPGSSTAVIGQYAVEYQMEIVLGMFEKEESQRGTFLYNSAVMVGPGGLLGKYRKIHQPVEETAYYSPGDSWQVYETPRAKIGLMICYDQSFPEAARELALRGAEVLAIPNAWAEIDSASVNRYDIYGRARAAENNLYAIQSNQVGESDNGNIRYIGLSRIIDPNGLVIAETPEGQEGLVLADIEISPAHAAQKPSTRYLEHRVPSSYKILSSAQPPNQSQS